MTKEEKGLDICSKLIQWKVRIERFRLMSRLGCGLTLLGIIAALFIAIAAAGAGTGYRVGVLERFSPLPQIAAIVMGLGLLLFVIGIILYGIVRTVYGFQKQSILKLKAKEDAVVDCLISYAQHKNYGKYGCVISIIGDIANKRAITSIIPALKDKEEEVSQKAAKALGSIGDIRAVEPLIIAMEDKSKEVRQEVAKTLDKLSWKPKDDTDKAHYLLAKKQWANLAKLGKPAVVSLINALKDKDIEIRQNVAETLGKIGDERASKPLSDAMKDKNNKVRETAKQAFEKIIKKGQL